MNVQKLNTHFYDTSVKEYARSLPCIEKASRTTAEEKARELVRYRVQLSGLPGWTPAAGQNFDAIVRDGHGGGNYAATDDLYADDLLYVLATSEIEPKSVVEQLVEMSSGMCAQGRCFRLFQLVSAISDLGKT